MANPYQYMNPIGAALVGVPDAYRAEMQKKRDIEMQQMADSEAARKRNEEAQFREDVKGSFKEGYGSIGMDELAQKRLQAGDIRGLEYGQRAEDIGQQEDERKRAAVNITTRALANSLLNGTPAEQQQYTQEFDSHFGTKSDIMESQDPETGERRWTVTQVDKDGKQHSHEVDAKQMRQWALTGIAPDKQQSADIKYQDLERKQQEGQQKLGQGERKLEQGDRALDIREKGLTLKKQISSGSGAQPSDNLIDFALSMTESGQPFTFPRSKQAIDLQESFAKKWKERGGESPALARADFKAQSKALSSLVEQDARIEAFANTAKKNSNLLLSMEKGITDMGSAALNKPIRVLQMATGSPELKAFNALIFSLQAEYSKLVSGEIKHAIKKGDLEKMGKAISENSSFRELKEVLDTLSKEASNRKQSVAEEIDGLKGRISGIGKKQKYGESQESTPAPSGYTKNQGKLPTDASELRQRNQENREWSIS